MRFFTDKEIFLIYGVLLVICISVTVVTVMFSDPSFNFKVEQNLSRAFSNQTDNQNMSPIDLPDYEIIKNYSTKRYFIQGLEYINTTHLIMSEGIYGDSAISYIQLDDTNNKVTQIQRTAIADTDFGEGAAIFGDKVYQLTWMEKVVYVYNLSDLSLIQKLTLPSIINQGWGITHDSQYLYISNGSTKIFVCNPVDLQIVKTITVDISQYKNYKIYFNELELVDNYLYANNYLTSQIFKIDIATSQVVKVYSFEGIATLQKEKVVTAGESNSYDWNNNVLNGIAFSKEKGTFLITGKRWDYFFEVKFNK